MKQTNKERKRERKRERVRERGRWRETVRGKALHGRRRREGER